MDLVVVGAFGTYAVGDRITDATEVRMHMDRPNVVRVDAPTTEASAPTPADEQPAPPSPVSEF